MNKISTGIICVLYLFSGCAMLGSKAKVYDKDKLAGIKNVAFLISAKDQNIPLEIDSFLDSAFTKVILDRFNQNKYFTYDVLPEKNSFNISVVNKMINMEGHDELNKYDALFIFQRKLSWPLGAYSDSKADISIYDIHSRKLIMYVSHNTALGNSYWTQPKFPGTLVDATNGVINKLFIKMKTLNMLK